MAFSWWGEKRARGLAQLGRIDPPGARRAFRCRRLFRRPVFPGGAARLARISAERSV